MHDPDTNPLTHKIVRDLSLIQAVSYVDPVID